MLPKMVRSEEVGQFFKPKLLRQRCGKKDLLTRNSYFGSRPHPAQIRAMSFNHGVEGSSPSALTM
jgi:hypothetical protein